jgi:hypothetical protein
VLRKEAELRDWSRWEKMRKKGFLRFVLVNGVLYWGVLTGLFFAIAMSAIDSQRDPFLRTLCLSLVAFPIGGVFWGLFVWFWTERKYLRSHR